MPDRQEKLFEPGRKTRYACDHSGRNILEVAVLTIHFEVVGSGGEEHATLEDARQWAEEHPEA